VLCVSVQCGCDVSVGVSRQCECGVSDDLE